MKIDRFHANYAQEIYKNSEERKKGFIPGEKKSESIVEISSEAHALVKKINASEEANFSEKVENIRKSVQNGTYEVNPDKIADKILEKIERGY